MAMCTKSDLVNFCLEPFVSSAETSSVQADGYHVTNILSTDTQTHTRGFRVEHFIRPPVTFELRFTIPLHIGCILVEPELLGNQEVRMEVSGSMRTSVFRHMGSATIRHGGAVIHMLRNRNFETVHGKITPSDTQVLGSFLSHKITQGGLSESTLKYSQTVSALLGLQVCVQRVSGARPVAIKFLEVWGLPSPVCSTQDRVEFSRVLEVLKADRPFLTPSSHLGIYHSYPEHGNSHHSGPCRGHGPTNSARLQVHGGSSKSTQSHNGPESSITDFRFGPETQDSYGRLKVGICSGLPMGGRVSGSSFLTVPCESAVVARLGSEAIAAQFPRTGNEGQIQEVQGGHLNHRGMEERSPPSSLQTGEAQELQPLMRVCSSSGNPAKVSMACGVEPKIPERFLDEITCELMMLPMLLPSGHHVDRNTLDRLRTMNATYGREDCDPFTGMLYSDNNQPQFCAELKAEIDMFSLSGTDVLEPGQGRTLGTASDILQHLNQHTKGVKRGRGREAGREDTSEVKRSRRSQDVSGTHSGSTAFEPQLQSSIQGHGPRDKDPTSIGPRRKWDHEVAVAESLDKALKELY